MKKALMMAVAACVISMPAMAEDKMMEGAKPGMEKPMASNDMNGKMEKKADMWFDKMDTDKDGMISKEEHEAFGEKMFMDTDSNKDGKISMDEMKAMKMKEHAEMKPMKGDMKAKM